MKKLALVFALVSQSFAMATPFPTIIESILSEEAGQFPGVKIYEVTLASPLPTLDAASYLVTRLKGKPVEMGVHTAETGGPTRLLVVAKEEEGAQLTASLPLGITVHVSVPHTFPVVARAVLAEEPGTFAHVRVVTLALDNPIPAKGLDGTIPMGDWAVLRLGNEKVELGVGHYTDAEGNTPHEVDKLVVYLNLKATPKIPTVEALRQLLPLPLEVNQSY